MKKKKNNKKCNISVSHLISICFFIEACENINIFSKKILYFELKKIYAKNSEKNMFKEAIVHKNYIYFCF